MDYLSDNSPIRYRTRTLPERYLNIKPECSKFDFLFRYALCVTISRIIRLECRSTSSLQSALWSILGSLLLDFYCRMSGFYFWFLTVGCLQTLSSPYLQISLLSNFHRHYLLSCLSCHVLAAVSFPLDLDLCLSEASAVPLNRRWSNNY